MRLDRFILKCSLWCLALLALGLFSCSDMGKEPNTSPVNHPPVITSNATVTAFEDVRFVYRATASDEDGAIPTVTFANVPGWLAASGDTIYGTPAAGTPDTSFLVTASDGTLSDTLLVSIMVVDTSETPNRPPAISSPDTASAVENAQFSYTATASDPDGSAPSISFAAFPAWLVPSAETISGTPAVGSADTSFWAIASDGLLTDTLAVIVTVHDAAVLISYSGQVQPVFTANCAVTGCHAMGPTPTGGLRLMNYNAVMAGGNSGDVIVPSDPDNSLLVKRIEGTITPRMPFGRPPLPDSTIQMIRAWIAQGAQDN